MAHGTGNPRRTGIAVFVALLLLTAVTVLVSYVDLGLWNVVVALLIASAKASLGVRPVPDRLPLPHPHRYAYRHDVALIPRGGDNPRIRIPEEERRCWAG